MLVFAMRAHSSDSILIFFPQMVIMKTLEEVIRKWTLKNAADYKLAIPGKIIGRVIGECPDSKADMKDKNGNTYYYWSDGSIRNMAESSPNSGQSIMLQRDYKYETDLREMNIDGLGKYSETTMGIPLTLGFDFIIHDIKY